MYKKTIDPVTGTIFLKHPMREELSKKEKRWRNNLAERVSEFGEADNIYQYDSDEEKSEQMTKAERL